MGNWQSTRRRAAQREALFDSARAGDVERVRELVHGGTTGLCFVKAGVDVDTIDDQGRTALMLAVDNGHKTLVRFLVASGANVNAVDRGGRAALSIAVEHGDMGIVEILFDNGAVMARIQSEDECQVASNSIDHEGHTNTTGGLNTTSRLAVGANDQEADVLATDRVDDRTPAESNSTTSQHWGRIDSATGLERGGSQLKAGDWGGNLSGEGDAMPLEMEDGKFLTAREDNGPSENTNGPTTTPEWIFNRGELHLDAWMQPLGSGGFGQVYRAKWLNSDVVVKEVLTDRDETHPSRDTVPSWVSAPSTPPTAQVAQTTHSRALFSTKDGHSIMQMFRREADIWFRLNHPHVVQLFGACDDTSEDHKPIFVSEFATNGPLDKYLATHPEQLWQKLYETALGIQYLHERGIVHGDLKCDNIVVGSDLKAKLTDFGLSSVTHQVGMTSVQISGAVQWVAPECLGDDHKPATIESDVYSLGMCIIQALRIVEAVRLSKDADQFPLVPWESMSVASVIYHVKRMRCLPTKPETCTDAQWTLVKRMCAFEPGQRIKIASVISALDQLARTTNVHHWRLESEVVSDAVNYNGGEFVWKWEEVERMMEHQDSSTLHRLAYRDLKIIVARLQETPTQPTWLLDESCRLLAEFCKVDLFHRHRILDLRSSLAMYCNLRVFGRRLQRVWVELCGSDSCQEQALSEDIFNTQVDLLVSENPPMSLLSADFDAEGDRSSLLAFLNEEMTRDTPARSAGELAVVREAYREIGRGRLSLVKPKWFIPMNELSFGDWRSLSAGAFGNTQRAKWLGSDVIFTRPTLPWWPWRLSDLDAVECSRNSDNSDHFSPQHEDKSSTVKKLQAFIHQIETWFRLNHPHVIRLYGACHIENPYFVCEFASNGSLNDYLSKQPGQIWEKLLEAARGVQYLHERRLAHGDLKGSNILVCGNGAAKVTGDSLISTTDGDQDEDNFGETYGSLQWAPPECIAGEQPTPESDIYALGMCIVEAVRVVENNLNNRNNWESPPMPWGGLNPIAVAFRQAKGQSLPPRPSTCSDSQWGLVEAMCRFNPQDRIPIGCVIDKLQEEIRLSRQVPNKQPEADQSRSSAA